ncbi:hypothetical protein BXZ70DRAFT_886506 [Cristinia sonorae]|uniref:Uncharacterized protein n=1 Tax=Cristinia sonorae TaxID=1940300 RepID=A0A8K0XTN9_9AGAR|nr:hypothetical protein BXZ70DRAFT_886506 [Cristinia sonorae]
MSVPNLSTSAPAPVQENVAPPKLQPSPTQLEALHSVAASGDLKELQARFNEIRRDGDFEPFALANDASPRTGLTVLHAASSRGHLNIVKWCTCALRYHICVSHTLRIVVEHCGAIPDIEDREGETALHKAALHGHLQIITYLLPDRADVHAQDADGWTALHNACSKGYLDIVRWLCESGGASADINGAKGVDIRSKGGWTPLMNAASKGHLPVVLYLLTKQSADPLVRNNWGETAYDAAAAVFEVWICEVLQKAESERWRGTTVPYNSLAVHTTVPLVLYEYQRLDMRLKTLAMSGGKPKFSASGLGKRGHRAPFELKLPQADDSGKQLVPAWRSDVQLPLREEPLVLPSPSTRDHPSPEGAERSHFWLSDWTLDVTHPGVDAELGWQYAHSFDDPDAQWTAQPSGQLERLLSGSGAVSVGLGGSPSRRSSSRAGSSRSHLPSAQQWVRRRRWVRVMRRRLDIPPMPFMQPDGMMYHLDTDGGLIPFIDEQDNDFGEDHGQEMGSMPTTGLSSAHDYVARARYLAGSPYEESDGSNGEMSTIDVRRAIAKLERATTELRQGILSDHDAERKTQAEVLLNAYSRDLERRRIAATAQGLLIFGDSEDDWDEDDSDDEEFHYPGTSPVETMRAPSIMSNTTDYFGRSSSRGPADLTPHLSQASEFRVPTHEAPQKVLTPRWTPPTPHQLHAQWERDETVTQCRECRRRFTFINRRHCRRCGRIFCDRCSSYRTLLDPSDVVVDPAYPEVSQRPAQHRVCQGCYEEVTAIVPNGLQGASSSSMERIFVDQRRLSIPSPGNDTSSQISDLAECPVCNTSLGDIGPPHMQEAHVRSCLEGGGSTPQAAKYLVYNLPSESTLIGTECVICLDEFVTSSTVARLSCLCTFHNTCLTSWLQRGRSCPVHAR